ncbi:hypothetical protein [Clostridium fermenticellae]|nr:hypothetical protein [Clostridium fermenticellae]
MYYSDLDYMRTDDYTNSEDENFESECPFSMCPFVYQTLNMPRVNPPGPPPSFTPNKKNAHKGWSGGPSGPGGHGGPGPRPRPKPIDSKAIRPCRNRFAYIWQTNGNSYWAYITSIGPRSISGFRWTPRGRRWTSFGLDLRNIEAFSCS